MRIRIIKANNMRFPKTKRVWEHDQPKAGYFFDKVHGFLLELQFYFLSKHSIQYMNSFSVFLS